MDQGLSTHQNRRGFDRYLLMTIVEHLERELPKYLRSLERHNQKLQRVAALARRNQWKKADLPRLMKLQMPSIWSGRLSDLAERTAFGRGVVANVETLDDKARRFQEWVKIWADPNTPARLRREMYQSTRWFPDFVEAAYRGELEELQKLRRKKSRDGSPQLQPFEQAEWNVAEAACISVAQVRKYCHQVRRKFDGAPDRFDPPTSARSLRDHLEKGPPELRGLKIKLGTNSA